MDVQSEEHANGYEKRDANLKWIVGTAIVGVVIVVAVAIFLNEYFIFSKDKLVYETVLSPESKALRDLRAREDELLNSYGVIDREKGIYRIPIDRAMKVLADEAFESSGK
jgi:hypothetical protein